MARSPTVQTGSSLTELTGSSPTEQTESSPTEQTGSSPTEQSPMEPEERSPTESGVTGSEAKPEWARAEYRLAHSEGRHDPKSKELHWASASQRST